MDSLLDLLTLIIAAEHVGFMLLEMLFWTRPTGRRVFGLTKEFSRSTQGLAANQGLYNGFLAAGLIWAWWSGVLSIQLFFLSCVFIAGVFGALSVSRKIFWIQALPAMLALILLFQL